MNVLVTGGNGQLAKCIRDIDSKLEGYNFIYKDASELNILNEDLIKSCFLKYNFKYLINCAAYTAVDKAESDADNAHKINTQGSENLAKICSAFNTTLIHISTDFVFNGDSKAPYKEEDKTNPIGVYGASKLNGEQRIKEILDQYFIIRTSWLYSEHGENFLKTMLRLSKDHNELGVVGDQIGSPTYAKDLAAVILKIIEKNNTDYGLYHYSNLGVISWFDFASEIFSQSHIIIKLNNIKTEQYPTPAERPNYSVLDASKISKALDIEIPNWKDSLSKALSNLTTN
ncbi:dTDP-4-dehydrorhamnose reductase [uncultured Winogradskyella sp.]|uniref:dTDP-4-dehydrorhamnose reductase n=1 Tax=uncultured Winogradskyella sp. TaxID=395353 RepID=UPI0030D9D514|tara:strand:+ start:436 stop:1293 length:858 start_codon:yes stop_codon:yes gene_type:complete